MIKKLLAYLLPAKKPRLPIQYSNIAQALYDVLTDPASSHNDWCIEPHTCYRQIVHKETGVNVQYHLGNFDWTSDYYRPYHIVYVDGHGLRQDEATEIAPLLEAISNQIRADITKKSADAVCTKLWGSLLHD